MYTFNDILYSDLHKDARGVRPGEAGFNYWDSLTPEEKQVQWDGLLRELDQRVEEERVAETRAIERFEAQLSAWVQMGARCRETAIRWIHDAEGTNGDSDYLCYRLGLPYGYLS